MNLKKLNLFIFCCTFLSIQTSNALAIPLVDGNFDSVEWAGYYADDNGVVGPGVGGQAYDAERLGLYFDTSNVSFGLQSGFDLASGRDYNSLHFNPGDLAINVDGDSFYEYAIDFTISSSSVAFILVDMTLAGATWNSPYYSQHSSAAPFDASYDTANIVGTFSGVYGDFATGQRIDDNVLNADPNLLYSNVIEGNFNLDLLTLYAGGPMALHWTMECGNDIINQTSEQAPVPEPATIFLFGTGLVGFAGVARKKVIK